MITVGIKNLRNSLSKYINIVKTGETIVITDHNQIVAELRPSEQTVTDSSLLNEYLEEQSIHGSIIKSTKDTFLKKKKRMINIDPKTVSDIYSNTRDERL